MWCTRCCIDHLCNDGVTCKSLNSIRISKTDQWKIDSNTFQMFMEDVRAILFKQKTFDFNDETCFNDEGFQSIVGLAKGILLLKTVAKIYDQFHQDFVIA